MEAEDYGRLLNFLMERESSRAAGAYKGWATRIDKDTGKDVRPSSVKKYLKKKEDSGTFKGIRKRAKGKNNPEAYEWATKYKIAERHFAKKK
jgi:predicted double-glycine peptidase